MKAKPGEKSYYEMKNQDEAWQAVLKDKDNFNDVIDKIKKEDMPIKKALFLGCGSSYYISLSGSFILSEVTGIDSRAIPASELMFYPEIYTNDEGLTLIFAVSRSGQTTELLEAVRKIQDNQNLITVAVTCHENSELADLCDYSLVSHKGREKSIVMTKSFTSLLLALQFFSGLWSKDMDFLRQIASLPEIFAQNIAGLEEKIKNFVEVNSPKNQFDKYEFLGQGSLYGIANEAMLKMKEMAIVPSEDFHSLEFRHGPKSIVDQSMLITLYLGDRTRESEIKLAEELSDYGAALLLAGKDLQEVKLTKRKRVVPVELKTELAQQALTPLYLVPSQLFAYYVALEKGIDVDEPRNLSQVVENI